MTNVHQFDTFIQIRGVFEHSLVRGEQTFCNPINKK